VLKRSAVILAGGSSRRFGQNKGLLELAGMPLIFHVVDKALPVVDEQWWLSVRMLRGERLPVYYRTRQR